MREWKALLVDGQPLYDETEELPPKKSASEQLLEDEKERLLNEGDFNEYRVCSVGFS